MVRVQDFLHFTYSGCVEKFIYQSDGYILGRFWWVCACSNFCFKKTFLLLLRTS